MNIKAHARLGRSIASYYKLVARAGSLEEVDLRECEALEARLRKSILQLAPESDFVKRLEEIDPKSSRVERLTKLVVIAEEVQDDLEESEAPKNQWPVVLVSIVILAALAAIIFLVVKKPDANIFQYRMALALLCFALSSLSALVFAVKSHIRGTIGLLTITLGGPGVLWIAALLIFQKVFPESLILKPSTESIIGQLSREYEEAEQWKPYLEWKDLIGDATAGFANEEEKFISQLLTRVFYHGIAPKYPAGNIPRPANVQLNTLFIYGEKAIVKFQRIRGDVGPGGAAMVYVAAAPSKVIGETVCFCIKRGANGLDAKFVQGHGNWEPFTETYVDCLIVTLYFNDALTDAADWVYVDVPKYVGPKQAANSTLEILFAKHSVKKQSAWHMTASRDAQRIPAPLIFQQFRPEVEMASSLSAFNDWFNWIEQDGRLGGKTMAAIKDPKDRIKPENLLASLREALHQNDGDFKLTRYLTSTNAIDFPGKIVIAEPKAEKGLISVFTLDSR